ncbi:MAG: recombinase family protein [Bacteroidia bacterium]
MKTAYAYIRISDDDQSHFSIGGQEKMNIEFGVRHNITITKTFIDDGYSAKDFNRPQWKALEKELAKNKSKVDYLIVWKYDRLIRNAAEGLTFIEKLEKKWNIILISVMENFGIDPNTPYFFKHRADLLVSAEFERRLISDRTKMGNWSAKDSGRFIGRASIGYINARDNEDLPLLVVDQEKKPIVEQVFNDFLRDIPFKAILQRAIEKGVKIKGHDAVQRIISNHTYAGLVSVPEYHGRKSYLKKGIHEPIIPEEVFWKAFYKLKDQTKSQIHNLEDKNVPLRGFLLCKCCTGYFTGGKSKGRSNFYYYYRCKNCNGENYSAPKVHSEIIEILASLSFQEKYVSELIKVTERKLKTSMKDKSQQIQKVKSELAALNDNLDSLEKKQIENKITQETYDKWFPVYKKEINLKNSDLADLEKNDAKEFERYKMLLPKLTKMDALYEMADIPDKQAFLRGIFWGGFTKEKEGGRTALLNPMFAENSLKISALLKVERIGKPENISGFPFSTRKGT